MSGGGGRVPTSTMKMFSQAILGETTVEDARPLPRNVCFTTSAGTPGSLGETEATGPVADSYATS